MKMIAMASAMAITIATTAVADNAPDVMAVSPVRPHTPGSAFVDISRMNCFNLDSIGGINCISSLSQ